MGYKWVRFKGGRWEIVYVFSTELMRMNITGFISTKLIVEYGPNIHTPDSLNDIMALAQYNKGWKVRK